MTEFEFDEPKKAGTNLTAKRRDCRTCNGDRFVTVNLRSPYNPTPRRTDTFYEEVAPCPDCNPIEVTYWVLNKKITTPDPAATRRLLAQ